MSRTVRAVVGVLLLAMGTVGCAGQAAPVFSAERECQRSGGAWRSTFCENSAGGGY